MLCESDREKLLTFRSDWPIPHCPLGFRVQIRTSPFPVHTPNGICHCTPSPEGSVGQPKVYRTCVPAYGVPIPSKKWPDPCTGRGLVRPKEKSFYYRVTVRGGARQRSDLLASRFPPTSVMTKSYLPANSGNSRNVQTPIPQNSRRDRRSRGLDGLRSERGLCRDSAARGRPKGFPLSPAPSHQHWKLLWRRAHTICRRLSRQDFRGLPRPRIASIHWCHCWFNHLFSRSRTAPRHCPQSITHNYLLPKVAEPRSF